MVQPRLATNPQGAILSRKGPDHAAFGKRPGSASAGESWPWRPLLTWWRLLSSPFFPRPLWGHGRWSASIKAGFTFRPLPILTPLGAS